MEHLNRRAIITGASATAAAFIMPVVAATANANVSDLSAMIAQWQSDYEALTLEGKAVDALEQALIDTKADVPIALTAPIPVPSANPVHPASHLGWSIGELDRLLCDKTQSQVIRHNFVTGFVVSVADVPLSQDVLDRVQQLKQLRLSHDAAIEAHFADHAQRQKAWEQTLDEADALFTAILETRPSSWAQLHRKTDWLRSKYAQDLLKGVSDQFDVPENLIADIQALTATA